ncbi:hypothetical protein [Enterobacter asburiae]|nr:hypothetical protein [Salmonella enterica]EJG8857872.1 hypothetical protein [Salmonella enterica]
MKDIRELFADKESIEQSSAVFSELKKEFASGSDRGMTIVSASMLDNLLKGLLEQFMIQNQKPDDRKRLFSNNGPLSSFSNKMLMAHSLGLISDFEKKLLNNIRSVRNRFAHELAEVSFNDSSISSICDNMIIPDDLLISMNIDNEIDGKFVIYKPQKENKREVFQMAVYVAITMLSARRTQINFYRANNPEEFSHRSDYMAIQINAELHIQEMAKETIEDGKSGKLSLSEEQMARMHEIFKNSVLKLKFLEREYNKSLDAIIVEKEDMFQEI